MVKMIFAVEFNTGLIGDRGELPWRFKEDLKFFRDTTMNKLVLCGRSTFDNIPELPGRSIILCTRDEHIREKTSKRIDFIVNDIDEFFKTRDFSGIDLYVIGGSEIYRKVSQYADELIVTAIEPPSGKTFKGDSYIFPFYNEFKLLSWGPTIPCKNLKDGPMKDVVCNLTVQRWVRK